MQATCKPRASHMQATCTPRACLVQVMEQQAQASGHGWIAAETQAFRFHFLLCHRVEPAPQ